MNFSAELSQVEIPKFGAQRKVRITEAVNPGV